MALVSSNLRVITKNQMDLIHEGSLHILDKVGVLFQSAEARDIFKRHGAKVDGEIVHIPRKMVEQAVELCPSTYRHHAPNPENDTVIGHRQKTPVFAGVYGSVFVLDPEAGRRPGTMEDYRNFIKLFQATDIMRLSGGLQVDPRDADPQKKFFQLLHMIIKHSDKCYWGFYGVRQDLENQFEMVKMALGKTGQKLDRTYIGTAVCPLSPLRFTQEHGDTIQVYAENNQVVFMNSCIMAGISGPISLLGTATLINTEVLTGLVLAQLTNPGCPVVYESGGTVADLKTGQYTGGGPESNLIAIAGLQMGLEMYKMPTRVMAGLSDAKAVDYQAGVETMQNLMMPIQAGAHIIHNAIGNMDQQLTTSFEKYILDVESAKRVLRVMQGIDADDQDLSLDIIADVGHTGNYLMHQNTFMNFNRRWRPELSIWADYPSWEKAGSPQVTDRATAKYKEMLAGEPESRISPELDRDLIKFIEKVEVAKD